MAKEKAEEKVYLSPEELLKEIEEKMEKAIQVFSNEVRGIRTGRATSALVDNFRVEYYGSPTPLKQIATISVPEPRLLVIRPFDSSSLKNIEKAIIKSDLGLTPSSDGRIIRLPIPPLSEERRKQLSNQVKDLAEKAKIAIRSIRRDGVRQADTFKKDSVLGEDEAEKLKTKIQDLTKTYEGKVDTLHEDKKKEILEF